MLKRTAALCLAAAMALSVSGCKKADTTEQIKLPIYDTEAVTYEIATAQYMDISQTESMGAVIGYPYADNLYYPDNAQIVSFSAVKGRTVAEGDILAELDSSDLDYEISNQQTVVDNAYAASLSGGESARLTYEIEKSRLDMMIAEKDGYTIRAPYDGIITYINRAGGGDEIEVGAVCCAIAPEDRVEVYVEGRDCQRFRFGQNVTVRIDGEDYSAVCVQAPDSAPSTVTNNAKKRAYFRLDNNMMDTLREEKAMAINAGWATVYVTTERKNVLAVPDSAVKTVGSSSYVTLVDGEERFRLNVTVGQSLGGYTEILNGISEGDVVIADGSGVFTEAAKADNADEENGDWGDWERD